MRKLTILACLVCCAFSIAEGEEGAKVKFVQGDNEVDVMIGDNHFTSYLYSSELTKPILYPVITPSGIPINRSHPLVKVEGESRDHPHHVGIFFTYDRVNKDGFWNNTKSPPQIKHIKTTKCEVGDDGKGTLSTIMHWIGKSGQVLLQENREMVFHASEQEYTIDFSMDLIARDEKVVFSDTKEGMFAIRVADWLRERGGSGKYTSSTGGKSEGGIWGKRAKWVCLQGEKDGKTVGIAILNHPASVNYPTYWHARGYGLFSANPLGQQAFDKKAGPLHLTLEPGKAAHFGFRVIIYEGPRTKEQLEQRFEEFSKP